MQQKNMNELKISTNILTNKLKNLKDYDLKYGTNIIPSLSKNILTYDDVFTKQLNPVNVTGFGQNDKHLNSEIESVTNIYNDLLSKISYNKSGCGPEDEYDQRPDKELNTAKKSFLNMLPSMLPSKLNKSVAKPKKTSKKMSKMASNFATDMGLKNNKKTSKKVSKKTTVVKSKPSKKKSKAKKVSKKVIRNITF